ncbi:unnamed protein product, partial [Rotaria sordida]
LILAVTILSVQMRPHGGHRDQRPPLGNSTFHFDGTFASSINNTDHQYNGFHSPRGHEGGSGFRPGRYGGGSHP